MKIRCGFVSNSSSSSFVINSNDLTPNQMWKITNHREEGEKLGIEYTDWAWSIDVNEDTISGYTSMDNFDMYEFLEKIGVDMNIVKWGEG